MILREEETSEEVWKDLINSRVVKVFCLFQWVNGRRIKQMYMKVERGESVMFGKRLIDKIEEMSII